MSSISDLDDFRALEPFFRIIEDALAELVDGEQGYEGPFTRDVEYQTCSVIMPAGSGCAKTVEFTQPRS